MIRNLIFEYNETSGDLIFKQIGRNLVSHSSLLSNKDIVTENSTFTDLWGENGILKNMRVAQVSYVNILQGIEKAFKDRFFIMPCNLDWSTANSRRFTVSLKYGKCLKFVASSFGDIFVVFATNPNNEWTWYFIQISSYGVALYKVCIFSYQSLNNFALKINKKNLNRKRPGWWLNINLIQTLDL